MEFKLNIRIGGAAVLDKSDIAALLREAATDLEQSSDAFEEIENVMHTKSIIDYNGNRVGGYAIKARD